MFGDRFVLQPEFIDDRDGFNGIGLFPSDFLGQYLTGVVQQKFFRQSDVNNINNNNNKNNG